MRKTSHRLGPHVGMQKTCETLRESHSKRRVLNTILRRNANKKNLKNSMQTWNLLYEQERNYSRTHESSLSTTENRQGPSIFSNNINRKRLKVNVFGRSGWHSSKQNQPGTPYGCFCFFWGFSVSDFIFLFLFVRSNSRFWPYLPVWP